MTQVRTVTRALMGEHHQIRGLLDALEAALEPFDLDRVSETLGCLEPLLSRHRRNEEEIVFPALRRCVGATARSLGTVEKEHALEEAFIEEAKALINVSHTAEGYKAPLIRACASIISFYRNHLEREEAGVFLDVEREIPDPVKWELMTRMGDMEPAEPVAGREGAI